MSNPSALLVESFELNEASGNRTGSDSTVLIDTNTVGSVTGHVYPLAATFVPGNNEFLNLVNTNASKFDPGTGNWAVEFWAKLNSAEAGLSGIVAYGGDTTNVVGYRIGLRGNNAISLFVADDSSNIINIDTSGGLFSDDTWTHFIVNFDKSDQVKAYINDGGTSYFNSSMSAFSGFDFQPISDLEIGKTRGADYMDGSIGPIRFYNDILDADMRTFLYNSGSGRTIDDLNPSSGDHSIKLTLGLRLGLR